MMSEKTTTPATDYDRIAAAIQFVNNNFRSQPSLEEIAAAVHLSKHHFQRLFKRWAGISPTQFLHYLTVDYAKTRLDEASSVLEASLDAGLSGPGRLHDLFVTFEAMSPGDYKRQGADLTISYGLHPSPFGTCLLATTKRGICALRFVDDDPAGAIQALSEEWAAATLIHAPEQTETLVDHIFNGPRDPNRPFHLLMRGTNFQIQVWQALLSIPSGGMMTYGDVAQLMGRPSATRAAASAIARNPIGYLVPCHRVIASTGRIHNYRWGTERKNALLGWEAAQANGVS